MNILLKENLLKIIRFVILSEFLHLISPFKSYFDPQVLEPS